MARIFTILLALALALIGCGDDADSGAPAGTISTAAEAENAATPHGAPGEDPATDETHRDKGNGGNPGTHGDGGDEVASGDQAGEPHENQLAATELKVADAVRAYVAALDRRDGETLCALLADEPGLDEVDLPRNRGSCGGSVAASIGYRDPRGLPVWESAEVTAVTVNVEGDSARAVATVLTEFADRSEPSIEDDVVYLARSQGRWLIAKPSSTLLRAVGIADVPPSVLTPP